MATSAPHHPGHEPVASCSDQSRAALQEEVMAGKGTAATGGLRPGAVGEPSTPRSVGVAGSTESHDREAEEVWRFGLVLLWHGFFNAFQTTL